MVLLPNLYVLLYIINNSITGYRDLFCIDSLMQ